MVNVERIKKDIETMAEFTSTPGEGVTRLSFSDDDRKAREYIKEEMNKAGLKVYEDAAGTVFGRREGSKKRGKKAIPIMIGSHFDSVPHGGAFDGTAGVVAALEIARVLNEEGIVTEHPVEFVAFIEEEGSRFGSGLYGSRAIKGDVSVEQLKAAVDDKGISMYEAMKSFGLDSAKIGEAKREQGSIAAFIELHIEQGPILEHEGIDIGIVDSIVGISEYEVEIIGSPDHAGTTPMDLRHDALVEAADLIIYVNELAKTAGEGTVGTVGKIRVEPGAANVVPGRVTFTVDIRSGEQETMDEIWNKIREGIEALKEKGFDANYSNRLYVLPVKLDEDIKKFIEDGTQKLGYSYKRMASGAGHDAMVMASIAPTAMVFVPSKNGKSHCPEEWTDYEDLAKGIEVVFETLLSVDKK
ncbi:MAG: Zn-dependent hydrolase [Thermoanaerobacteraceae bacterium]|nr:Zn-dependent hydrolase [Thermoanaerobacteraceae bacterium]